MHDCFAERNAQVDDRRAFECTIGGSRRVPE